MSKEQTLLDTTSTDDGYGDTLSDKEESSEEIEPKLKYFRMSYDLHKILVNESVTCLAVHPKFVFMGSSWGLIHLLDHQGNDVLQVRTPSDDSSSSSSQNPTESSEGNASAATSPTSSTGNGSSHKKSNKFPVHTVAVNQISIDSNGDFIATCSDDGKVYVHGLYSVENNHGLSLDRSVKSVAIDPNYYKQGSGRRFVTGDKRLVLHEKTFLSRLKSTVLCEAEGTVQNIKWKGQFIAWASDIGLRVYDINARCSLVLFQWSTNSGVRLKDYRCNICWKDNSTLLVGWVDCVRICVIRRRLQHEMSSRDLSEYKVEETSTFQTDFFIAGIGPLGNQLVLLGYSKELDENNLPQRPALHVIEPHGDDYIEITTDNLSLRGYQDYKCNNYHLECLNEENNFFVVSPKDVVIASPYDADDRLQWLMDHGEPIDGSIQDFPCSGMHCYTVVV